MLTLNELGSYIVVILLQAAAAISNEDMDLIGLAFVAIFYLVILLGGIWIARKKGVFEPESWEQLVLANRDLGLSVGIFTLIATEVGGAFVNGTAEEVYKR